MRVNVVLDSVLNLLLRPYADLPIKAENEQGNKNAVEEDRSDGVLIPAQELKITFENFAELHAPSGVAILSKVFEVGVERRIPLLPLSHALRYKWL